MRRVYFIAVTSPFLLITALGAARSAIPDRLPVTPILDSLPVRQESPSLRPYGVGQAPYSHRPATSCSAASCHGGGKVGHVGSEFSTWAPEAYPSGPTDPHTRAYRVLFNPVSVRMANVLNLGAAHKAELCLKCHAVDGGKDPDTREQILAEGVGCGGCHGPAEKWIGEHYTSDWKALSARDKWEKYGFVPTKNLVARALNCASCHTGDADRDVNHDLYAAGHPRITFEAARLHFQTDYRQHWTETTPQPDFEVRQWIVGQAAGLRSATDLLRARAERAGRPDGIWPEFAGYSCYSCHQRIGEGEPRARASTSTRAPGIPGWEVWSNTAIEIAGRFTGEAYPGVAVPALAEVKALQSLMERSRAPAAKEVAERASKALVELDHWLAAMQAADDIRSQPALKGSAERLAHALAANALSANGGKLADHDWDALASNYLGCAAMFHASGGAKTNSWARELEAIRDDLLFPIAKVLNEKGSRFDSPYNYNRKKLDRLKTNFERLRDATAAPGGK